VGGSCFWRLARVATKFGDFSKCTCRRLRSIASQMRGRAQGAFCHITLTARNHEPTLSHVDGVARWAFTLKRSVHAHSSKAPALSGRMSIVLRARLNTDRRKSAGQRVHGPQPGHAWTSGCLAGNIHMWAVGPRRTRGKTRHRKLFTARLEGSAFGCLTDLPRLPPFTADQPVLASSSISG